MFSAEFADPGQLVAQARLAGVLGLDGDDERAADEVHAERGDRRIDDRGEHHVARDDEVGAEGGHAQAAADRPQDADEGGGGEHRIGHADEEIDQRLGREAHVVGDAVFGVRALAADDVELVEAPLREPALDQARRDPLPPAQGETHAHVHEPDRRRGRGERQRDDDADADEDGPDLLVLDGVEEEPVPAVDAERRNEVRDHEGEDAADEQPGAPLRRAAPEPARELGEFSRHATRRRLRWLVAGGALALGRLGRNVHQNRSARFNVVNAARRAPFRSGLGRVRA